MKGKFPDILNNPATGETARALYDDAQAMLDRIIEEKWLTANAVFGFFPASAVGDDIEVYADESRARGPRRRCATCASRASTATAYPTGRWVTSSRPRETGLADHVGAFAVTAGLGARTGSWSSRRPTTTTPRSCSSRWPTASPRPSPSGCTSGSARSSGATSPDEDLDNEALIAERYAGIRPAPGLSRLPRAHREEHPVGAARRPGHDRHRAHREHGDVAGRGGLRAGTSPTRSRSTSSSAGSVATRSPTTPSARAGPWPRPSGGSRPTSATTRMTDPGPGAAPRRSCGTWTAPWSTPSRTGSTRSSSSPSSTAAPGASEHALSLVGNDLLDVGSLHPRAHGHRPDARADRRGAARRRGGPRAGRTFRGGPGARELLADAAGRRRTQRARDHVLHALRGADPRGAARPTPSRRSSPATGSSGASPTRSPT